MRFFMLLAVTLTALPASAVSDFDLERLALNPGGRFTLLQQSGDALDAKELRVGLLLHYEHEPLLFMRNGEVGGAVVGGRFTTHLSGAYGIFPWLEVALQLPVVFWQGGDDLSGVGIAPVQTTALGAPWLQARFGFLRQDKGQPLDVALSLALSLPLGSSTALTRDPGAGVAFTPRLGLGRRFGWFRIGGELGTWVRGTAVLSPTSATVQDEVGSSFTFGVVASAHVEAFTAELGFRGAAPFTSQPFGSELQGGVRQAFLNRSLEVSLLGGLGFGRAPGNPAFRVLAGVAWTPRFGDEKACVEGAAYTLNQCPELDRDRDGVPNRLDACPENAGPSVFRGCPDRDDDADGVPNAVDTCPDEPGNAQDQGCPKT